MANQFRSTPWWVVPLLLISASVGFVALAFLVAYAVVAGLFVGLVLLGKTLPKAPVKYMEDPPTKSWDALWGWVAFDKLALMVRLGLLAAAGSFAGIIVAAGEAGELSAEYAWGLLGATAVLAGIESVMRHRRMTFRWEAGWVAVECGVLAAIAPFGPSDWALGVATACALEICGFVIAYLVACSRV